MAKTKFNNFEEAQEAQTEGKATVREAKEALTSYFKENKLKRNVDYSNDAKHGKKVTKLQNAVDKASESLAKVNEALKDLKPQKERVSKYDYPEGLTSEEKKKFRQVARAEKGGKTKKEKPAKAEKTSKAESKTESKTDSKKAKRTKKKSSRSND